MAHLKRIIQCLDNLWKQERAIASVVFWFGHNVTEKDIQRPSYRQAFDALIGTAKRYPHFRSRESGIVVVGPTPHIPRQGKPKSGTGSRAENKHARKNLSRFVEATRRVADGAGVHFVDAKACIEEHWKEVKEEEKTSFTKSQQKKVAKDEQTHLHETYLDSEGHLGHSGRLVSPMPFLPALGRDSKYRSRKQIISKKVEEKIRGVGPKSHSRQPTVQSLSPEPAGPSQSPELSLTSPTPPAVPPPSVAGPSAFPSVLD